jgi:hypothetical protein
MDVIVMQVKDEMASANPDLHFNSATVRTFHQLYASIEVHVNFVAIASCICISIIENFTKTR